MTSLSDTLEEIGGDDYKVASAADCSAIAVSVGESNAATMTKTCTTSNNNQGGGE